MKTISRRSFLKSSLLTTATLSFSARSWSQVAGANSQVRAAIVGFGGRGKDHIKGYEGLRSQGVKITALCDVDNRILNAGVETFRKRDEIVEPHTDIRRLLEKKDIDVISIATPNHWHALATIWAVQAGKDVYVEKPVCHNVWEGRKMVEAARKHNRIVQAGTQSRSSQGIKEAVAWVSEGNLGKIVIARALCYKPRASIGKIEGEQPIPSEIDYDIWCGPAPKDPLRRAKLHYDWHWLWNYGNGDLGNQGIHQMDIARWFLGEQELSPRVFSLGGRFGYVDDGETPNTQIVYHGYTKAPLIFEVRGLPRNKALLAKAWGTKEMDQFPKEHGGSVCVVIHCEGGHILVPGYSGAIAYDNEGNQIKQWQAASDHFENFINAVRSRKRADLHADILEGFLSSALCHTGNISYRLGDRATPDEIREKIKAEKGAEEAFQRMLQHLEANEIDLTQIKATVGMPLKMDAKTERFIDNTEANALLTRYYRRPYVVPEKV